eukprot:CAMPEP_0196589920 /NCGR_PEP_ID=MMETSP1081-20130531/65019_1 /TAXON_ID=36882 /ORGANISM="Pyramimonas amylifera, Strain CCMP720" /LENGTH=421 /DNA_ID=CAMNT_0041912857 /DNA_START=72 /DNA_END=1337 /DNA_ORIENTATION=-
MFVLLYATKARVCVHTANLVHSDWNNKTQGVWFQDFPLKGSQGAPPVTSPFEEELMEYMLALGWKGTEWSMNGESRSTSPATLRQFDFSKAEVRLVGSVPGYHRGTALHKWGHMKLRTLLSQEAFPREFCNSPVACQFSSLGSINPRWLAEFQQSLCAGAVCPGPGLEEESLGHSGGDGHPSNPPSVKRESASDASNIPSSSCKMFGHQKSLGMGPIQVIWPTVQDMRTSTVGYTAGCSFPSSAKNVSQVEPRLWHKWEAGHSGRQKVMPHMKSFTRYQGGRLAWFLLSSSNLSQSAWGSLQKQASQLFVRSYELGVLISPSTLGARLGQCWTSGSYPPIPRIRICLFMWDEEAQKSDALASSSQPSVHQVHLQVPYQLPPSVYNSSHDDRPWCWELKHPKQDAFGKHEAKGAIFYGVKQT